MFDNLPPEMAAAFKPIIEQFEAAMDLIIQKGLDRLNGAKITITVEIPPQPTTTT